MTSFYDRLLQAVLDIGEDMQNCGAEISRVEDSISRMCRSYDVLRVSVFTITSNITVTLEASDGAIVTQTRRIRQGTTDFTRLDRLNALSRYICAQRPDVEEIRRRYHEISAAPPLRRIFTYLGGALAAASFAVFFGGVAGDALAAGLVALLVETLMLLPIRKQSNPLFCLFLTAVLTGLGCILLVRIGVGVNLDKILIGCIMLTIPGLAITNAIRDLLSGDTFSGLSRLCESLLQAGSIAGGFCLVIYLLGRGL